MFEEFSEYAWDTARHALSDAFTKPITGREDEVTALAYKIDAILAYDYKFVPWNEFVASGNKPAGLIERAEEWKSDFPHETYVVYDPLDDECGFLLISHDPVELAKEACQYISDQLPEEGPLSVDNAAKRVVEDI